MEEGNGMKVVSATGSDYTVLCYGCSELFDTPKKSKAMVSCPRGCLGVMSLGNLEGEYEGRMLGHNVCSG